MSTIKISLDDAKQRYPEHYASFVDELRGSTSKSRDLPENKINCSIYWCERISDDCSFEGFLSKLGDPPQIESRSAEEIVKERLSNISASVEFRAGRFVRSYQLDQMPQEIVDEVKEYEAADEEDRARDESLTPEEKDAEVNSIVQELFGHGGFIAISRRNQ